MREPVLSPFLTLCSRPPPLPVPRSAAHHSADPSEVDEKFSELLSPELSRHAPTTSRKFHDVNAIAIRFADRRPDSAYLRSRASFESATVSQTAAGFRQHRGNFYARAFVGDSLSMIAFSMKFVNF